MNTRLHAAFAVSASLAAAACTSADDTAEALASIACDDWTPGELAQSLGVRTYASEAASDGVWRVTVSGEDGALGVATLTRGPNAQREPLGHFEATWASSEGASWAVRSRLGFGADGELVTMERYWTLGDKELEQTVEYAADGAVADTRWSTPAESGQPVPAGGTIRLRGGERWVLRTVDPSVIEGWLRQAGLWDLWTARDRLLLEAVLIDGPALLDTAATCKAASALRTHTSALESTNAPQSACWANQVRCRAAAEACDRQNRLLDHPLRNWRFSAKLAYGYFAVPSPCVTGVSICAETRALCDNEANGGVQSACDIASCSSRCLCGQGECRSAPGSVGAADAKEAGPQTCVCRAQSCCSAEQNYCVCGVGGCIGGDPRIVTADRQYVEYQGVGEYVAARSDDGAFEVQMRTKGTDVCGGFSFVDQLAVRACGAIVRVRRDAPDSATVDGEPVGVNTRRILGACRVVVEPGHVIVESEGGDEVAVGFRGTRWLNVTVRPSPSRRGTLRGLLGDFDGDAANDLRTAQGGAAPQPLTRSFLEQQFGASWRVAQADSLFAYAAGESTATFTDTSYPRSAPSASALSDAERASAEAACASLEGAASELRLACQIDVGCGGGDAGDVAWFRGFEGDVRIVTVVDDGPDPCSVTADGVAFGADGTATFVCPDCTGKTYCYGTDVYSSDSSVCSAAAHAGAISLSGGGVVTLRKVAPPQSFESSERNGVVCAAWGFWPGAFEVVQPD